MAEKRKPVRKTAGYVLRSYIPITSAIGPDSVLRVCEEQARELALRITNSYATGPTERGLVEILKKCGGSPE